MSISSVVEAAIKLFGVQSQAPPEFKLPEPTREAPPIPAVKEAKLDGWTLMKWEDVVFHAIPLTQPNQKESQQMNMFTILKAIYEIIKQIELAFPGSPGVDKLNAAMDRLNAEAGDFIADKLPLVQKLVNSAVAVLNILGVFKKTPKAVDSPAG